MLEWLSRPIVETDILMERTPARRYQPKVSMNDL